MKVRFVIGIGLVLCCPWACDERKPSVPTHHEPSRQAAIDRAKIGLSRPVTLRALCTGHRELVTMIGPHRFEARSKLTLRAQQGKKGGPSQRKIVQRLDLVHGSGGSYHLRKRTHRQYGREVIWDGKRLHIRRRWQKFLQRPPADRGEPARLAARLGEFLPAYLRLLWNFTDARLAGESTVLGRKATRVVLTLRSKPDDPGKAKLPPAETWRTTLRVSSLAGEVWVDAKTGAPLKAALRARWSFAAPDHSGGKTGIPRAVLPEHRMIASLDFRQRVVKLGSAPISPPDSSEIVDVRRRRLELERRMIVGERPLVSDWRTRFKTIER